MTEDTTKPKRKRTKKLDTTSCEIAAKLEAAPVKTKKYLTNSNLMVQIELSRQQNQMTDELAKMLVLLCDRYSKHPDFASIYSYKEDMVAFAQLTVVKVWRGFNPERSKNPFAYFTQIIKHAFYQYLNHEAKNRLVKDELLVKLGELPSYTYMENYREDKDFNYEDIEDDFADDDDEDERPQRHGAEGRAPGIVKEIDYAFGAVDSPPEEPAPSE